MKAYQFKNWQLKAVGYGGVESCYIISNLKIAFDAGRCPFELVEIPTIFLTHGHLDHAAGLPYYFSQRSLKNLPMGTVYTPSAVVEPLKNILKNWQIIEDYEYPIQVNPLEIGQEIPITGGFKVKALQAFHRVPCQGYAILRNSKKLKPEYLNYPGQEIKKLKEQGEDIFEVKDIPEFAFSGDSLVDFITHNKEASTAKTLLMECTYIDEKRSVSRAREWGHTHLDEIIEILPELSCENLVLTHFSRRYRKSQIEETLQQKLSEEQLKKITFIC